MTTRLAMTIAGAVSLGSFEAGVMFEVLDAISQHNAGAPSPDDRIEVDVLTGASAGGMTACLTAQKLLFEGDRLTDPYDNDGYRAWVRDISLDGLLAVTPADDPAKSVLASSLIEALSRRYLTARYAGGAVPLAKPHPAAARTIKLGLSMSNLNGVDYRHPVVSTNNFVYTRYQDTLLANLEPTAACDTLAVWERLRAAAVCCGAFPFAFRVRDLARAVSEYEDPNLVPLPGDPYAFTYTDGGVFQNEPLGLAKNLVDEIDEHQDVEHRRYLFVSPGARLSTRLNGFAEGNANVKTTLVAIMEAIFNQARFHDWITAEAVNDRVRLFDLRAEQLRQQFLAGGLDAAVIAATVDPILTLLLDADVQRLAAQRLRAQFASDYAALGAARSLATADTWIRSILLLEAAADMGTRDEMTIFGVTAEARELASSGVFAFVGFFDARYRTHDYDVGRTKAQAVLTSAGCPLGRLRYVPQPIRAIDHSLDGLTLDRVERQTRQTLAGRLGDYVDELLKEFGVSVLVRWGINPFFVKKKIDKLLGLS